MVLTDREIQVAIAQSQITIEPPPSTERFSSTSLDLTLSPIIRIWRTTQVPGVEPMILSPGAPDYRHNTIAEKLTDKVTMGAEGHVIKPGGLITWPGPRRASACRPIHDWPRVLKARAPLLGAPLPFM